MVVVSSLRSVLCKSNMETIDKLVSLYKYVAKPTISGGWFRRSDSREEPSLVTATWSQRNIERGQMTKFRTKHLVTDSSSVCVSTQELADEQLIKLSHDHMLWCIVRSIPSKDKATKQILEVWNEVTLLKSLDVAGFDVHGDIYVDAEFGCLEWSPDKTQVVYIAEQKKVKSEPFHKQKSNKKIDDEVIKGTEYLFVEDWGEQLVGKSQPVIVLCDLTGNEINVLKGLPENLSPGQLIFDPKGNGVYGIAYENDPRRLGLIYCSNRPGTVFHLSFDGNFTTFSKSGQSPRLCRVTPDGQSLIWLQRPSGGPHDACQELVICELLSNSVKTLVPIVTDTFGEFLGIYTHNIASAPFSADGKFLIFDTINGTKVSSFSVNIETGDLKKLSIERYSTSILDVYNNNVLLSASSILSAPQLLIYSLDTDKFFSITSGDVFIDGNLLSSSGTAAELPYPVKCNTMSYMFLKPNAPPIGLIVIPHGGPHGALVNSFMLEASFFLMLKLTVLFVNYRGSTGAGQDSVDSLLGHIGDMDVKDVQFAVETVIAENSDLNLNDKVVVYGGSHGGFLSLHLIGQYPDAYRAAVVRNPVVDLPPMLATSDIPDWVAIETGNSYRVSSDATSEERSKMGEMSPMRYIDNVKADTLLLVGCGDLRVPPSQSIHYYKTLKARGIKTKLHLYDDSHPLSKVPVHFDALINSALWISEALGTPL